NYQLSIINYQLSIINYQLLIVDCLCYSIWLFKYRTLENTYMFGMNSIKEMQVQELFELLSNSSDEGSQDKFRLLDVRTPAEVARGKIADCENVPLHLVPLKVEEFKEDRKLIIYCQTGARSAQACAFLASKGINNVFNVRGGIVAWAQSGFPVSM
ncbi:MAG: rhodanese-like domain-containing protein, partial [Pseudomonadota bacterium]